MNSLRLKTKVLAYFKDPKLAKYAYKINSLLSYEAHILPKEQEDLLAKVESIADTSSASFRCSYALNMKTLKKLEENS